MSRDWKDFPREPYVSKTRGENLAPMALAMLQCFLFLEFSLCWAKCPLVIMAGVTAWLAEGFGCVIVTSANSVEKLLSVTTRSMHPRGLEARSWRGQRGNCYLM